jgi:hypothetical protein
MTKRAKKIVAWISAIIIVIGLCLGGFVYYRIHAESNAIRTYPDQSHDPALINRTNAHLDAEMASAYAALQPRLVPFGLHIPTPPKSHCGEGDPSLFKYACGTIVRFGTTAQAYSSAADAAQKLTNLDTYMTANGWKIGGNDFRSQQPQPASQWAATLAASAVQIEYSKADCDLEFSIYLSGGDGLNDLSCSDDLLPGFYY